MNTLAALISKLRIKAVTPETRGLCELFDVYRAHTDDEHALIGKRLETLERKVNAIHAKLTSTDSE